MGEPGAELTSVVPPQSKLEAENRPGSEEGITLKTEAVPIPSRFNFADLPSHLQQKFFREDEPIIPDRIKGLQPGQRELLTLALFKWCQENGKLPPHPDPDKPGYEAIIEIEGESPLKITFADQITEVKEIRRVTGKGENAVFTCKIKGSNTPIEIPASQILEAQSQILEQSSETGCIKGSSLRKFLENQKIQPQEGQELTEKHKQFNETLNNLIEQIKEKTIVNPDNFADVLSTVLATHPEKQTEREKIINLLKQEIEKIDSQIQDQSLPEEERRKLITAKQKLQENINLFDEKLKNQISELAKKMNDGSLTPQEIDEINKLLETGNIDSLEKILEDKPDDNEETKQKKETVRKAATWLKEKGPMIGGIAALLLLLMILQASKSDGIIKG